MEATMIKTGAKVVVLGTKAHSETGETMYEIAAAGSVYAARGIATMCVNANKLVLA